MDAAFQSKKQGLLYYRRVDVGNAEGLESVVAEVAANHNRLDGLVAAAGVQNVQPALEYPSHKIDEVSRLCQENHE